MFYILEVQSSLEIIGVCFCSNFFYFKKSDSFCLILFSIITKMNKVLYLEDFLTMLNSDQIFLFILFTCTIFSAFKIRNALYCCSSKQSRIYRSTFFVCNANFQKVKSVLIKFWLCFLFSYRKNLSTTVFFNA